MKYILCLNIFTNICPLSFYFPFLDTIKFNFILLTLTFTYTYFNKTTKGKIKHNRYILILLLIYILSELQHFWLNGIINAIIAWSAKGMIYYVLIFQIKDLKIFRSILWTIVLASIVLMYNGWEMFIYNPQLLENHGRLQSIGNYNLSNSFGLYITVVWPLSFFLFEYEKNKFLKMILIIFLVTLFISLVYTKSRGSLLGCSTAIILSIVYSKKIFSNKIFKIVGFTIIFIAISSFALVTISTRNDITSFTGKGGEASTGDRLEAWTAAIKMAIDHPFLGVGWKRFVDNAKDYGMERTIPSHNTFLNIAAEIGIVGLYCYIAIMITNLIYLFNRIKFLKGDQRSDLYHFLCGTFISILCFNINSMFSVKDHDPILWILFGIAGSFYYLHSNSIVNIQPNKKRQY